MFGLEGDVEGEGEQRGVDGPRTVDGHLRTDASKTLPKLFEWRDRTAGWHNYKDCKSLNKDFI